MLIVDLTKSEARRLKGIYTQQEIKIKAKLELALERGNDGEYLAKILLEIQQEISTIDKQFGYYSKRLKGMYTEQVKEVDKQVFESGIEANIGKPNENAINILAQNTRKSGIKMTMFMGRKANDFLREVGLKYSQGVIFGSDTWKQASKSMIEDLKAKKFFSIDYKLKDGTIRKVPCQVYTEMVARTTSAEAHRMATIQRIQEYGGDLVKVYGHSSYPNSPCIPYQGKDLSISGDTKGFIALEEAKAQGFLHPNCVHSLAWSEKNKELIDGGD